MSKAASFKNDVDISGNLDVTGNLILNGAMSVNSDITVISGNIGIGTTTPQVALDVSGDVVISNTLKVDGSLSIYGVEFPNPTGKNNNVLSVSETGELAWTQSNVVNIKGQSFFDLLTDAPREFTPVSEIYSTTTIEICWNFDDIIPSNRYLNLPLLTTFQRSLPAITEIFFDISTTFGSTYSITTDISSQYSINIEDGHDYATSSNAVSGVILNSGSNIIYTLTYRSLSLTVDPARDYNTYSINIWGVNGSNNKIFYKLPYRVCKFE